MVRADPAAQYPRVGLVIANAPWHKGAVITAGLTQWPHLEVDRRPSYSPQLQVIERFWRVWRRRATHHRRFLVIEALKEAWRKSLRDDQTLRPRVLSLSQSSKNRTKLSMA
jgi:transposase